MCRSSDEQGARHDTPLRAVLHGLILTHLRFASQAQRYDLDR